ncbi:hypothetical protein GCM10025760_30900 [Microbacterium yannicii]|uniref:Flp pilus-assembly TadG-like N-terminal domain-containing protein n=1 Tax=Microbacterium yannicii TaxID=671622 RepID=A0ABP9MLE5_9MICO|nr:hypothetical protein [Microbacterium yannicii]MCO5951569.1 hypothetical protein [Microbacterium yannicii]
MLIVVLVVMLVLSMAGLALAVIVTETTGALVGNRDVAEARAAADAGIAAAVATARSADGPCGIETSASDPQYSAESECGDGAVTFTSTGTGSAGAVTVTEAVYLIPWVDYSFDAAEWPGWDAPVRGACDFPALPPADAVAEIEELTEPTVIDLRNCGRIDLDGVELEIQTDVALIVDGLSGRNLTVRSSDGVDHAFHIIAPDDTVDQQPTCPDESRSISLRNVFLDEKVSGQVYSPCTITLGRRFAPVSRWNGQVYGGEVDWIGSTPPSLILAERSVDVPGLSLAPTLGPIVSQRDVR